MHDFESYPLNREQVAYVCCVSEAQVKGWAQDRGRLFPEKEQGRGTPWTYALRDAMKLGVVSALVDHGFSVGQACDAIRPHASPIIHVLNEHESPFVVLAKNGEGRWIQTFGTEDVVSIHVNAVKVYHRVAAGIEEVIREDPNLSDKEREAIISTWNKKTRAILKHKERQLYGIVRGSLPQDSVVKVKT